MTLSRAVRNGIAAVVAATLLQESHAFVCSPDMLKSAPANRQVGEECGGTCNSAGTCAVGLRCQQQPMQVDPRLQGKPELLGALHAVLGTSSSGVCVRAAAHEIKEEDEVALKAVEQLNAQVNSLYMYVPLQIYDWKKTSVREGNHYELTIEVAPSTCYNDGKHKPDDDNCKPRSAEGVQAFKVEVLRSSNPTAWTLQNFEPVPTREQNALMM
mmetsp:Transcript_25085/g.54596  ORF Transcript_25085/g.54596 Transcript_25085/m.54596 type:complete len:213 (-) Transcript_25085:40-678(-)